MEDQLRLLLSHLQHIFSFLRRNEAKEEELNAARLQVHEAEKTIHPLAVSVAKYRIRGALGRIIHVGHHFMMLRRASSRLESILETIKALKLNGDQDTDRIKDAGGSGSLHKVSLVNMDEHPEVLSFGNDVDDLVSKLIDVNQTSRQVISIVGRAGSGKTTLANQVYGVDAVKHHFLVRAWVRVPQNCRIDKLLQKILESIAPTMNEPEHIVNEMLTYLQGKRYLIVMDNFQDINVWGKVESAFPDNKNGSRILLTSQGKTECMPQTALRHDVRALTSDESWRLFSTRIHSQEARNNQKMRNLEAIKREIATQCEGLPFNITLLSTFLKEQPEESWLRFQSYLSSMEENGRPAGFPLQDYIYQSLPDHLSSCFLYFGMFPSGKEIPARQLIQLWIAEGFVHKKGTLQMESVGEEYLDDLIRLGLVQMATRRSDGGVKACRIHDNLHDYCISKGTNQKFFEVCCTRNSESAGNARRLSIHVQTIEDASIFSFIKYSDVHSFQLSIQDPDAFLMGHRWNLLKKGFQFLRVLNLGFVNVRRISEELGQLIHLRYLRIKSPGSRNVPPSLCNLLNLLTLDMRESFLSSMPKGIWKMQQLRHLHLGSLLSLPEPHGIDKKALGNLQTLSSIRPNKVAKRLMVRARFPNLKNLKLFSQTWKETLEFLMSLDHLFHLESLKIVAAANLPYQAIADLPDANAFPLSLTKITLLDTHLSSCALEKLEKLPNLQILKLLRNSVVGEEITCNDGGFPQLHVLQLKELEIKRWTLKGISMRNLRRLAIIKCASLTTMPDHTTWPKMREVEVVMPTEDLRQSVEQFSGKKGCIINVQPLRYIADDENNNEVGTHAENSKEKVASSSDQAENHAKNIIVNGGEELKEALTIREKCDSGPEGGSFDLAPLAFADAQHYGGMVGGVPVDPWSPMANGENLDDYYDDENGFQTVKGNRGKSSSKAKAKYNKPKRSWKPTRHFG